MSSISKIASTLSKVDKGVLSMPSFLPTGKRLQEWRDTGTLRSNLVCRQSHIYHDSLTEFSERLSKVPSQPTRHPPQRRVNTSTNSLSMPIPVLPLLISTNSVHPSEKQSGTRITVMLLPQTLSLPLASLGRTMKPLAISIILQHLFRSWLRTFSSCF
jgi:hypothetical protein